VAACRAEAALRERDFVTPDDILAMAPPVLAHRLVLRPEYEIEGLSVEEVVQELLKGVPVPR
jgi:MoxR-like ATPase